MTYSRGQVDGALWKVFNRTGGTLPPTAFTRRITKLVELGVPFGTEGRPGKGSVISYTKPHVFEQSVGLTMLDAGFTQGDVAFLLKNQRKFLANAFEIIMDNRPEWRAEISAIDRPHSPVHPNDPKTADTSYFMTFRKVELREAYSATLKIDPKIPFIFKPKYLIGLSALHGEIDLLATSDENICTVIELSYLADHVVKYLDEAPDIKRGRRKKEG